MFFFSLQVSELITSTSAAFFIFKTVYTSSLSLRITLPYVTAINTVRASTSAVLWQIRVVPISAVGIVLITASVAPVTLELTIVTIDALHDVPTSNIVLSGLLIDTVTLSGTLDDVISV